MNSTIKKSYPLSLLVEHTAHRLLPLYAKEEAQNVALWLLQAVLNCSKLDLIKQGTVVITAQEELLLNTYISDLRDHHKPLAYVLGWIPFGDITLLIEPPILIPRWETEEWVAELKDMMKPWATTPLTVLDLCTGSGAIGISLAHTFPLWHVTLSDINPACVALAQKNAEYNNTSQVEVLLSDLYESLPLNFKADLIVANPPYIDKERYPTLEPSVQQWEDPQALWALNKGLAILEKIIEQAPYYLRADRSPQVCQLPNLLVEIDVTQAEVVVYLLQQRKAACIIVHKDSAGNDRWISARLPSLEKK